MYIIIIIIIIIIFIIEKGSHSGNLENTEIWELPC